MEIVEIKTKSINLDQFLKWAGLVNTGGEAKLLISNGQVCLNGIVEKRRGKSIYPNDVVTVLGKEYKVQ